jgi:hypothetical protein
MPRYAPSKYYEGLQRFSELLELIEDPFKFNEETKNGKEQVLQSRRLEIMEHSLNFNPFGTGVCPFQTIDGHFKDLGMALHDNFNISPDHAEMCWKVALVWFRIQIFNTQHYFKNGPTGPILILAKYCPSMLWRIITLQNVPDGPLWVEVKGKRAHDQFRRAMDEAAGDDKDDVIRIKAKLVDYFNHEEEGLDYPDAETCKWLGMDSEEEAEEEEEDTDCCCDGMPRAGCPVHGANGNSRSFLEVK